MNKSSVTQQNKTDSFIPPLQGILQRQCACGNHTAAGGECAECKKKKLGLQRKLSIGASNDPLEQEADRVADQVMAMPLNSGVKHTLPRIQRFSGQNSEGVGEAPASVDRVLAGSGKPLEPVLRQDMEARFGYDFSGVRVHTGGAAEQSARDVNALAYTVGNNVVFGAGQFEPQSSAGKRLMAHELTHVVQQEEHSVAVQRLGANAGCSAAERNVVHQSIFNARGWINNALPKLNASMPTANVLSSLRRNFGSTYGVTANIPLIAGRIRTVYGAMNTIPYSCVGAADPICAAGHCGFAVAGSHAVSICQNATLAAGTSAIFQAGCVLHEAFHATFSNFGVDEYSGWHGHSGSTATYPGAGVDPLLNADSYTTLVMDLS